ncbi:MAG: hypothetical protein KF800_12190 [Lysobacter sp.]|nr:hypothetical protein [Lysobacter sp.]
MQGEVSKFTRRVATVLMLAVMLAAPASARDPVQLDRNGQPRSERAQWVYRIVAKWGSHVQEAYRSDVRRWADSMGDVFAKAPLPALRRAAEARSFAGMNDALLAAASPAGSPPPRSATGGKALGDIDRDLVYVPVTPCRILDTRVAGGPIPANSFRDFDLTDVVRFAPQGGDTSNCGVGDKGSFAAAALNITVVNPNAAGYITAFPYLASQPTAATINYAAGDIRNGLAIVRLDQSAAAYEFSVYSFAQTHLVADIVGYFREPEATALSCQVLVSAVNNASAGVATISSPVCPAGFTAASGGCRSENTAAWAYLFGSYSTDTQHVCQFWNPSGVRPLTAHVKCCRTPGK